MSRKNIYGDPCGGGCGKIGLFTYGKCRKCLTIPCEACQKPFMGGKTGHKKCPGCRKLKKLIDN